MPILNGVFSNRYQEHEDYEFLCGAEAYPYVILREEEAVELPVAQKVAKEETSFLKRISARMKFKFQI